MPGQPGGLECVHAGGHWPPACTRENVVAYLIDRRLQGKNKSAVNRDRFLRRHKQQIREAVSRAVNGRSITDLENGEKISIPSRDLNEPNFGHAPGGVWEIVRPGNEEYQQGDQIARPKRGGGGGGGGGQAGNSDETGEDDFVFEISREEFMQYFFEDLELPNLVKKQLTAISEYKTHRAGYTVSGTPSNIHVLRSLRGAMGRRIATAGAGRKRLAQTEEMLATVIQENGEDNPQAGELKEDVRRLKKRIRQIPFLDPLDLRYSNRVRVPKPSTQAVMFCIMDVSGSMDQQKKDIAKRFFILLYLFLERQYERIDVVFIRHHTSATEVSEEDFFHSRESGGTVVSSALHMLTDIIIKRYPGSQWNIYAAQASDGDNWDSDSAVCRKLMAEKVLPLVQYFAYVEITQGEPQSLWREYSTLLEQNPSFAMQKIASPSHIYPVFRELFKKQTT
jgi:uncharacterized sporulation protein YeaH/YhbH (DUF444 family)